ncbi:hypothetical protein [Nocardia sp. NRRL WC-3656]|uniref:hypothetical protein n=1 Tax=Nocardia sp. NRRL WC-3656 TaxID=1463824 RepID=UPI000A5574E5|nr:hypothetical protein [Nocardia sp. NRRL WC-3656]
MTAATTSRTAYVPGGSKYAWPMLGGVLAAVLVFDGLLSVVLEVLYLPLHIGATPFPIAALVAAVVNVLLVRGMGVVVSRPAAMGLPVIAWLFGFLICSTTGPGGDVLLTDSWTSPLLLACGIVPVGFYLFRRAFLRPKATPATL